MAHKEYYIFTSEDSFLIDLVDEQLEDYLNNTYPDSVFILTESGNGIIVNEEETRYMVIEDIY